MRTDGDAVDLAERLAALLEGGRTTRMKAGRVRVNPADIGDLVKASTPLLGHSVAVTGADGSSPRPRLHSPEAAGAVRRTIDHAPKVPLTDDMLLAYSEAQRLAEDLRRCTS